jgi:DNA-directed RNA polymerase specialized sigma24 family protein
MGVTAKTETGTEKAPKRKRVQNYLNNARLMENIIASKKAWNERRDAVTVRWAKTYQVEDIKSFAEYLTATNKSGDNIPTLDLDAAEIPKIETMDYYPSAAEHMTDELVKMIMMLVEKYATRANWRNYTYIDDMKSEALISLLNGTLKFDPAKSQNPFGYMTQIVTHSFLTTLDKEKKVRRIRDDILEQNGFSPSHTRQLENDAVSLERSRRIADKKEGIYYEDDVEETP